jgi:hypothetical protein
VYKKGAGNHPWDGPLHPSNYLPNFLLYDKPPEFESQDLAISG